MKIRNNNKLTGHLLLGHRGRKVVAATLLALLMHSGCRSRESPKLGNSVATTTLGTIGSVQRIDPALNKLIPASAEIEILAEGFDWAEGPVWVPDGSFLLFSDVPTNTIFHWKEGEGVVPWLHPSGYTGQDDHAGESGSNGLALDSGGRLVLCQHGDRRIALLNAPLSNPNPVFTTLADTFDGRRFNSPNDLAISSRGDIFFTDPPYGLTDGPDDPEREIDFQGVFRRRPDGRVVLVSRALTRPNGIALSPDEKTLYVANSDPGRPIWMAYDVDVDGNVTSGRVFFDAAPLAADARGMPDGMKVDAAGNLFATGPGGVLIFSPAGKHLGTINTTVPTANCAFGDGGSSLYITADAYLLRVKLITSATGS